MRSIEHKYIVALVGVFSIFMELLDTTVVNVAIPTLRSEFGVANPSTIQWVITGYLLSLAVFIPVSGWAADRFGAKRVFMFALTMFSLSSMLCALSWNIESLVAFRVLQGVGGGMLSPVAFAMVWRAFPPEERSKAAGIMVIPAAIAPASGPVVGGLLVDYASWHWIFLINVPIGAVALVISALYLREHREPDAGRFDPLGFVLSGAGLATVLYALSEAGGRGFADTRVLGFGIGGIALLAAFVFVELRTWQPMLDVRIFANGLFRACNLAWIVTTFGFSAMIFLVTLELQAARGLSPLHSGLVTFAMAIGVMLTAQPASRLYRVIGPRRLIMLGLTGAALSTLSLATVSLDTNLWLLRGLMLLRGIAFGFVLVPLQAATYAQVPAQQTGRATALYNATSQMGSGLGVAVAAAYLTNRLTHHDAVLGNPATSAGSLSAFQDTFWIIGAVSLVGVAVALLIRDGDAAQTMNTATIRPVDDGVAAPAH